MKRKEYYTTSDMAKILHVAVGSVINWVDDGQINAILTPGGHRKIPYKEVIRFLKNHNYEIPKDLLSKKPVYLVDDEEDIHEFFRQVFKNIEGFELISFYSGTDALISIGKQVPEIIIVDIVMPDIDGIQVIKNIRTKQAYSSINIVAISADLERKDQAMEAGANVFLKKPFDVNDLKGAIIRSDDDEDDEDEVKEADFNE